MTNKTIEQISKVIFGNYYSHHVILIGKTKYELPVSKKVYLSSPNMDNVKHYLSSSNTATFGFDKKATYDTYRLWYECRKLKPITIKTKDVYSLIHGSTPLKELKIWGIPFRSIKNTKIIIDVLLMLIYHILFTFIKII